MKPTSKIVCDTCGGTISGDPHSHTIERLGRCDACQRALEQERAARAAAERRAEGKHHG